MPSAVMPLTAAPPNLEGMPRQLPLVADDAMTPATTLRWLQHDGRPAAPAAPSGLLHLITAFAETPCKQRHAALWRNHRAG